MEEAIEYQCDPKARFWHVPCNSCTVLSRNLSFNRANLAHFGMFHFVLRHNIVSDWQNLQTFNLQKTCTSWNSSRFPGIDLYICRAEAGAASVCFPVDLQPRPSCSCRYSTAISTATMSCQSLTTHYKLLVDVQYGPSPRPGLNF